MSMRHLPRQPERDVRMHDPSPLQTHPHAHPLITHPNHLNGNAPGPATPAAANIVSPTAGAPNGVQAPTSVMQKLSAANEQTWLLIGSVAEQMGDLEHALSAYENALRHNPTSLSGLTQVAGIARIKENYPKAVDFFQRVLGLQEENGEVWSALGHCYLMQDDLQKAYSAYQQALYLLPNPKEDPKLWYGIGILYDRYGSLDHAEEAFSSVLRMDKDLDFDKANEILFRLGIIYKQQGKYDESLACFDRILRNPPSPLAHADIWFQIGHVYEQQKDYVSAKDAYERVVADNSGHAKVLQQLGWLYHQDGSSFQNQDLAIQYLTKSLEADSSDAQSWYLLGRAYMAGQKYNKAYEAYQQAVYRDGRNPTFWCSIGVLYFQINQFRDALDAYSRAIRINPYISEVWFDLGSLYESCNNQISDAIDAYARASELDPGNSVISQRLQLLKNAQATGGQLPAAPGPQDVHPTAYASAVVPPPGLTGPPLLLQSGIPRPPFRTDSRGPTDISLPPPSQVGVGRSSPGPFRGGPPPPVVLDETRHIPSHTPLAPMEIERPAHSRDFPSSSRDSGPRGHQSLLLHHPLPQPGEEGRNGVHPHHPEPYFSRPPRPQSRSISPGHSTRPRSPPPFPPFPPPGGRHPIGPAQPSSGLVQRSPRSYPPHEPPARPVEQDGAWDRRPNNDIRDWDRERRMPRHAGGEYPGGYPPPYPPRSPPSAHRGRTPEASPRSAHPSRYWEKGGHNRPSPPPPPSNDGMRRYDPRYEVRDNGRDRDYDMEARMDQQRSFPTPPEDGRRGAHFAPGSNRSSESPHPDGKGRKKNFKEDAMLSEAARRDRRRKNGSISGVSPNGNGNGVPKRREEGLETPTPKPFVVERMPPSERMPPNFKMSYSKDRSSPGPVSSNGSGSSTRPSPTSGAPRPPSRVVDEDYDEGVADALMGLAAGAPGFRARDSSSAPVPSHSPAVSSSSRHSDPSSRSHPMHRDSVSSTRSHASPPLLSAPLKRPLSPGVDELSDAKRSRMDLHKRRGTSPPSRHAPSSRPSPIPFRTQPTSRSPEAHYPPSPPLPAVLPPHPRPIGSGLSNGSAPIALPPIATLSPTSTAPSPSGTERDRDDRMQVDNRSISPPPRSKMPDAGRSPPKATPSPPVVEKKEPSS
ncbi:TPR-like protein [Armillaria borealis]|uniref:TPR-like protein n=1 Tax=Armillaria borealis TaxID=47425 RepID=A0AA39KBL0_9AGAR|nr:TPR-like protein [Armillaria borealis]